MTLSKLPENTTYDYQRIILDIAFNKPKNIKNISVQGIYYKGDIACEIVLENRNTITLRIWESHMNDGYENQEYMRNGKIFISAYLTQNGNKTHLPLFGWYDSINHTEIWSKILEV